MDIYGIDFTSAPSKRKPITCAFGVYKKSDRLLISRIECFTTWDEFESFLQREGPWFCGMDFPFGLPFEFLQKLSLPTDWEGYVKAIGKWKKDGFEKKINQYKKKRPKGEKEPLRIIDALTGAKSPLKLVRTPVAKMFFQGAPRLLKSGVSIIPCHPGQDNRTVMEAYPALLARRYAGNYKSDSSDKQTSALLEERKKLARALRSRSLEKEYGFKVTIEKRVVAEMINDATGDSLDAVICAVQCAWAFRTEKLMHGVSSMNHPVMRSEGWIIDPSIVNREQPEKNRGTNKNKEVKDLRDQLKRLLNIGWSLSNQSDLTSLLKTILSEARKLTFADGGTLYINKNNQLHFRIVQNETLKIDLVENLESKSAFPPIELDESHVSTYVVKKKVAVNIPDVYKTEGFNFKGPRDFDRESGYRTQSMLVVPMCNHEGRVIGVLQLINARVSKKNKTVIPFSSNCERLLESLASQAAVAITHGTLTSDLREGNLELIQSRDKALEANRTKSIFLANMSHELRTPMNAILGYSEILAEDANDQGLKEFQADLEKINMSGKQLMALINDILDWAKIEAGKIEIKLSEFAISEMVQEVVTVIRPMVQENNNKIEIQCLEELGTMDADSVRVRQMLLNLLSNACKFTQDGTICLKVNRTVREGVDWITFLISDTGVGISFYEMKKLFNEFTQIDTSSTRKFRGSGLGLAISRRFCRMMGGDITVKSKLNEGSTFAIHLPVKVTLKSHPLRRAVDNT